MRKWFAVVLICGIFFTSTGWSDSQENDMSILFGSDEEADETESSQDTVQMNAKSRRPKPDKKESAMIVSNKSNEEKAGEAANDASGAEDAKETEEVQIILAENKDFALVRGTEKTMPRMVIEQNRTLVPLHFFREIKNSKIVFNPAEKSVTIASNNKVVRLVANEKEIKVNGQPKLIDVPMKITTGRAYVPVRYISELFGYDVRFIKNSGAPTMVVICSKGCTMDYNRALEIFGS